MQKSFSKIIIFYLFFASNVFATNIDSGTCENDKVYAHIENGNNKLIYFWERYLVDAFNFKKSVSTFGYSYGNKIDCVNQRKEIQNWDVQLIAARYAHDTIARFPKFMNISDEKFCNNAAELLMEYCKPVFSVKEQSTEPIANVKIKTRLEELKKLLNEGLISQEQYDVKSSKILEEF